MATTPQLYNNTLWTSVDPNFDPGVLSWTRPDSYDPAKYSAGGNIYTFGLPAQFQSLVNRIDKDVVNVAPSMPPLNYEGLVYDANYPVSEQQAPVVSIPANLTQAETLAAALRLRGNLTEEEVKRLWPNISIPENALAIQIMNLQDPEWWNDPKIGFQIEESNDFRDMLEAAAIVRAGALGISGFAGLHGLPGIDSLLSGANNLFSGGGASSSPGGLVDLGMFAPDTGVSLGSAASDMAAQVAQAWTNAGVPMSTQEAAAYLAEGGTGFGATNGGVVLSAAQNSLAQNPISALKGALQGQVDAGVITPAQMQTAMQSAATTGTTGSSWLDTIIGNSGGSGLLNPGSLLSGGLQALGGYLSGQAATDAANSSADAYLQDARIAADAAKFRPVGVTTRFGGSQFGYDANGNLTSAGYTLSPDIRAQQNTLIGASNDALSQYANAQNVTAPMGQTAQTLFGLGQGYLSTTPEQQAAKYMQEQQALLAPYREREFANLENRLRAQGRLGLATGATSTGMGAANPELEAFYNAQRMQDLKLASEATKGGMDYTKFGAGLVGTGGDMLNSMYSTQSNAYAPYKTAIGGASMLEGLGKQAMDMGINIGAKGTAANAQSGALLAQGITQAAQAMQPANSYSPWGSLLSGVGTALQNYQQQNSQYKYDPYTGQQIRWGN